MLIVAVPATKLGGGEATRQRNGEIASREVTSEALILMKANISSNNTKSSTQRKAKEAESCKEAVALVR